MKRKCLVITPFDPAGRRLLDAVRRALEEQDWWVSTPADQQSAPLTAQIVELIRDAEVVVADVTRSNPQVMYEIGVAHGYRKPTVLLRDATADTMIFDIASHMVLVYEPNNLRDLGPRLAKTLYRL